MRKCNVIPYEGSEPYVFISYSHKDVGRVFPVLEYLASIGVRIWFDNGIHPGTDWIETIGQKLNDCAVFIPFISGNSLASHNCKNELNFAIMENKPALSVVLEPVEYSMALKMQMASIQGIMKYEFRNYEDYLKSFLQASCLTPCIGAPNPDMVVSEEWYDENAITEEEPRKSALEWFTEKDKNTDEEDDDEDETTVYIVDEEDDDETVVMVQKYFLVREDTGEIIDITHDEFKIGRKKSSNDYYIDDPVKKISREHMTFFLQDGQCFVRDNGAVNKTYLNGVQLVPQERYEITEGDKIVMASEQYTFTVGTKIG